MTTNEMHPLFFSFDLKPVAKGRPRAVVRGKFATFYTPKTTREYEAAIKAACLEEMSTYNWMKKIGPEYRVSVAINFYWNKTRGDLDNLAKSILDAMNGVCFEDDSQIDFISINRSPPMNNHPERTEVLIYVKQPATTVVMLKDPK